jgi:SAM-dependent methyltransferase
MTCADSMLQLTKVFWDANPCDGHADVSERMRFRYTKEPWLPAILDKVAAHGSVLEIGCGQGTDALSCCRRMSKGASYTAIDYSDHSIASARCSLQQYPEPLPVVPDFRTGNAESLEFASESFDCVMSIGVLHHTPDTQQALHEVHRVLKPGGKAIVALYRLVSPKVFVAHAIRGVASMVDVLFGRGRCLYQWAGRLGSDHFLGTMLLECLGVPILKSYTRGQIGRLFGRFQSIRVYPIGMGLPLGLVQGIDRGRNPLGALWMIEAEKAISEVSSENL